MKFLLLAVFLAVAPLSFAGDAEEPNQAALNVNSRYTVEAVELAPSRYHLSPQVVADMERLVGQHLNVSSLNRLSRRITDELRARSVTFRVYRGNQPSHVRVAFEVEKRDSHYDVSLSSLNYNQRQGWTGVGQASATFGANAFTMAGLSNGDDLVERYSGISTRYDRLRVGTDRVHVGFEFDAYREQFDGASISEASATSFNSSLGAGTYRSRLNFEPSATFVLAKPLTFSVGLSFEKMQPDSPGLGSESANTVVNTLRYHGRWNGSDSNSEDLDASYKLRLSAKSLGSDFLYTKHTVNVRYTLRHQRQSVDVAVMAGVIYGRAPLFERFVLGNNSTLRGWDKYELDPLGGNHVEHASVTYGYQIMRVFYDTGSVWDRAKNREEKHSVGMGITTGLGLFSKNALLLAVAFPLRNGRVDPVFLAGMNF